MKGISQPLELLKEYACCSKDERTCVGNQGKWACSDLSMQGPRPVENRSVCSLDLAGGSGTTGDKYMTCRRRSA